MTTGVDVLIIGAGAAGMMCAIEAAKRGRSVVLIDHANKAGKKILMSGGGRCNFTNLDVQPAHFLSHNPHFARSALSRYSQWDFIAKVNLHGIEYHEKDLGQLFCDHSAKDIQQMLLSELAQEGVDLLLETSVLSVAKLDDHFAISTTAGVFSAVSCVVACGGLSIPTLGASDFGFKLAQQFGHTLLSHRASLVPFTWNTKDKPLWSALSGLATRARVRALEGTQFELDLLITHRGLSGPAMLQISNYWQEGEALTIDWLPSMDVAQQLAADRHEHTGPNVIQWESGFIKQYLYAHYNVCIGLCQISIKLRSAEQ